jgi:undecaprenyl-diphosphatase
MEAWQDNPMTQTGPAFRGLLAAGSAGAVVGGMLTVEFARGAVFSVDAQARAAVHSLASPALTVLMRLATLMGSWAWLTAVTVVGLLLLRRLGAIPRARLLLVAVIGTLVLENGLKLLVRRARPDPYFGTVLPVSYSFPSGHALDSFVIYFTLVTLVAPYLAVRAERIALFAGSALLVLLIGMSRVYLGVHWPSDVLGGWAVGAAWLAAWAILARRALSPALSHGGARG